MASNWAPGDPELTAAPRRTHCVSLASGLLSDTTAVPPCGAAPRPLSRPLSLTQSQRLAPVGAAPSEAHAGSADAISCFLGGGGGGGLFGPAPPVHPPRRGAPAADEEVRPTSAAVPAAGAPFN